MTEPDPYADFRAATPSNLETLLMSLADDLIAAEEEVARIEKELEAANERVKQLVERTIPEATEGLDGKLTLKDGRELILKEHIRASIAGEKKDPAIAWLDENGYGSLVKRELVFEFDRKDQAKYQEFVTVLKQAGVEVVMTEKFNVHWQTLTSWVKERLKNGDVIPLETFGVFRQRTAEVKVPE